MPLYRLQEFEIKALHIKYKTSLSLYSWGQFLKSCPQIGVVFLMEWDWRYFFRWMRAGRQPGRWLVGGSAGTGVCAETRVGAGVGGSSRGSQDSAGRAGTRPWVCTRAGMFILGLFSVYRLDVCVDLQIISHQLNGCQRVILIFDFVWLSSLYFYLLSSSPTSFFIFFFSLYLCICLLTYLSVDLKLGVWWYFTLTPSGVCRNCSAKRHPRWDTWPSRGWQILGTI